MLSLLASSVVVVTLWTVDCTVTDERPEPQMSQSLRVVKRFRIRELALASPPAQNTRIPPAATAASNLHPSDETSPPSRSGTGTTTLNTLNPFVPHKNPESGRWAPPRYSLRRQADLIKHARASGTLHLLPPGPKMSSPAQRQQQQLLADTTTTTTQLASSSPSVLGKDHVEEKNVEGVDGAEAVVVERRSGSSVSLRQGEEVQDRDWEQILAVEEEGEAQGQEEVLTPEQNSLDAQVDSDWTKPVEWIGTVRERNVAGADVGNRLYAGKKRMFKGHKWERMRERRVSRTKMLLRDMDERIQRFKRVRCCIFLVLRDHSFPPLPPPSFF